MMNMQLYSNFIGNNKKNKVTQHQKQLSSSPIESDSSSNSSPSKPRIEVNARERWRTQSNCTVRKIRINMKLSITRTKKPARSVNSAYNNLRNLIPTEPYDRRLSKIEILRLASSYISHLDALILTGNADRPCIFSENCYGTTADKARTNICTFCAAVANNKS